VALKEHLHKSYVKRGDKLLFLFLREMRNRGMNIKHVRKFGCPICEAKDLVFQSVWYCITTQSTAFRLQLSLLKLQQCRPSDFNENRLIPRVIINCDYEV